jgi:myosin-7
MPSYDVEREATLSKSKFEKFVKSSYRSRNASRHDTSPLTQPLLAKKNEVDGLASLVVSTAIKRYCGDVSTPASATPTVDKHQQQPQPRVPVMTSVVSLLETLARSRSTSNGNNNNNNNSEPAKEAASSKRQSLKKLLSVGSSSKPPKDSTNQQPVPSDGGPEIPGVADVLQHAMSAVPVAELDLAQFVVSHGIVRKELRDEIYCQLCAQVTKNPSRDSCQKGWLLHTLCAGCFLPSSQLLKHYFAFLNEAPADAKVAVAQIRRTLHRTSAMGPRYHPPNWIEYQSVKSGKVVMLPVLLPDGRTETVEADSSTTAGEICRLISTSVGLRDQFGFAIYIGIYDKVSSLGQGPDHVMDGISECEQLVRTEGGLEEDAPWQLLFRKEIFTPWHDVEYDDVASDLIYRQIVHSVHTNEYELRSDDEVSRFIARRWYVEYGDELIPGRLLTALSDMLPQSLLAGGKSRDAWTQAVMTAFDKMGFAAKKYTRERVKLSVVESAKRKWPLHFSGLFEACSVSGLSLPDNNVVLAVSCRGVFILEEPFKVLIGLHYYELVDVSYEKNTKDRGPNLTFVTVNGEQWTFASPNSETIAKLLCTFLDGLRRRSRWAVAIQDFILQDHTKASVDDSRTSSGVFHLRQGDVVELMDEMQQQDKLKDDWMYGRCERSGLCAAFPFDCVYIIPTCERPPPDFMAMFTSMSRAYVNTLPRKRATVILTTQTIGRYAGYGVQSAI